MRDATHLNAVYMRLRRIPFGMDVDTDSELASLVCAWRWQTSDRRARNAIYFRSSRRSTCCRRPSSFSYRTVAMRLTCILIQSEGPNSQECQRATRSTIRSSRRRNSRRRWSDLRTQIRSNVRILCLGRWTEFTHSPIRVRTRFGSQDDTAMKIQCIVPKLL